MSPRSKAVHLSHSECRAWLIDLASVKVKGTMRHAKIWVHITFLFFLAGCAIEPKSPMDARLEAARSRLSGGRFKTNPVPERAADYLESASLTSAQAIHTTSSSPQEARARAIYNVSTAELTHLLSSADGGRYWNRPLTLSSGTVSYQLSYAKGGGKPYWSPDFFSSYIPSNRIPERVIRHPIHQEGIGGSLLGIRKPSRRASFIPKSGVGAEVTSTVEFRANRARLILHNPVETPTVKIGGEQLALHADYSGPLALHPAQNELLHGFLSMIQIDKYMGRTGLYFLEPYDPGKIPVIFVHGLMSTGYMWRNVANEVLADPVLRQHYQVWVFSYPSGNPIAYSALRLREELAKVDRLYAPKQGYVLVGHSMGGLLAQMQATTSRREIWNSVLKDHAERLYTKLPAKHLLKRTMIFNANPKVKRIIFVCVPHRGSELAIGFIGNLGRRLISLPALFSEAIQSTIVGGVSLVLGQQTLPTSIDSLSPKNPTLLALDKLPIQAPYHSIISDRGKGNTPLSSDGVVPYWSSHLEGAESELIVPGGHGAFDLPQTVAEIQRILVLDLKGSENRPGSNAKRHPKWVPLHK